MATYKRMTCRGCGAHAVPHNKNGEPLWGHTRTEKHYIGGWKRRKFKADLGAQCQPRESMTRKVWQERARCRLSMSVGKRRGFDF